MAKQKYQYTDTKKVLAQEGNFIPTWIAIPQGTKFYAWKIREGENKNSRVNVLPYIVGKGNPEAPEGNLHYRRIFYIHDNVGTGGRDGRGVKVACNAMNGFGKCGVCEGLNKMRREGVAPEVLKEYSPKKRHLYAFDDLLDPDSGYKIHESAPFKGFGDLIKAKLDADEDGTYTNFWHVEEGFTANVLVAKDTYPGGSFNAPKNLEFGPRKKNYTDKDLENIPCLDDCVVEEDFDKVLEMFLEGGTGEPADDAPPTKKTKPAEEDDVPPPKKKKPVAEEDDDTPAPPKKKKPVEEEDDDVTPPKEKKPVDDDKPEHKVQVGDYVKFEYDGKMKKGIVRKIIEDLVRIEVKGQERPSNVDLSEVFPIIEEDDDTPPPPKKKTTKAVAEEDEDDDTPLPPPKKKKVVFADEED